MIKVSDLQAISGSRSRSPMLAKIAKAFNKYAAQYGVTHQEDVADALAHFSVETGGFRRLDENMNYSAKGLLKTWPSRFDSTTANKMARKPQLIANHVYGDRMGNEGRANAGWLYRGSGLGQVTGYNNFKKIERETGLPVTLQPDLLRDPNTGTKAALILWQAWDMNQYAGGSRASRKRWNGGYHGLAQYQAAYKRAMQLKLSVPMPDTQKLKEVAMDAAAQDRMSSEKLISGTVTGVGSVASIQEAVEKVSEAQSLLDTLISVSPWLIIACIGAYWFYRRYTKQKMALEALS